MSQEGTVLRNLAVLKKLVSGKATLEDIAASVSYRIHPVERSLQQLTAQGLVEEKDGTYHLRKQHRINIKAIVQLIDPWLQPSKEPFYDIARDAARIILTKSWSVVRVEDVLLYGSTLRSEAPMDIDLVIFHRDYKLREFELSRYATEGSKETYDAPVTADSRRRTAFTTLSNLGYKDDATVNESVVNLIGKRIKALGLEGHVDEELAQFWLKNGVAEEDLGSYVDVYGVNHVFDIHVMHVGLLGREDSSKGDAEMYSHLRKEAITSCRDQTFWHRVFSEGRLYEQKTNDFAASIGEKYPKALQLFEVQK